MDSLREEEKIVYGTYRQADPEGDFAAQVSWEQLVDVAADYRAAVRAEHDELAWEIRERGEREWGEEAWERAVEYVTQPEVEHAGEPGYVGGFQ